MSLFNENTNLCFEFISAGDVPDADFLDESDVYIVAWLALPPSTHKGDLIQRETRISRKIKTPVRDDNPHPFWGSFKDFKIDAPKDAILVVEVWDEDYSSSDDKIGVVRIPLSRFQGFEPLTVKIDKYFIGNKKLNPNFSVTLRRVQEPAQLSRKTLFLVRHGQSKWNLGKKEGDLSV